METLIDTFDYSQDAHADLIGDTVADMLGAARAVWATDVCEGMAAALDLGLAADGFLADIIGAEFTATDPDTGELAEEPVTVAARLLDAAWQWRCDRIDGLPPKSKAWFAVQNRAGYAKTLILTHVPDWAADARGGAGWKLIKKSATKAAREAEKASRKVTAKGGRRAAPFAAAPAAAPDRGASLAEQLAGVADLVPLFAALAQAGRLNEAREAMEKVEAAAKAAAKPRHKPAPARKPDVKPSRGELGKLAALEAARAAVENRRAEIHAEAERKEARRVARLEKAARKAAAAA